MSFVQGGPRRLLKWTAMLITPLMLAALLALIFASAVGRTRSFVVDALATGAEITFEGSGNSWPLGAAKLCLPRPRPDRRAPPSEGLCDSAVFEEREFDGGALIWSDGAKARVWRKAGAALSVTAEGAQGLPKGAQLHLTEAQWRKAGALVFIGRASIGGDMASGQTDLLISGRYEAREGTLFGFGGATETVKSGDLRRGERVSLVDYRSGRQASGFGHISAAKADEEGFHIVDIAQPGDTALKIEYLGGERPNLIRPNWIDYALTSPFFVALALILSLMVGVGQLVLGIWESFSEKSETARTQAAETPPPLPTRAPREEEEEEDLGPRRAADPIETGAAES